MKLINKDKIVEEIESRLHKYEKEYEELVRYEVWITAKEIEPKIKELKNLLSFINNLGVKEVDLEKEYEEYVVDDPIWGNFITCDTMGMELAKHFFELGLKANQEYNVIGTLEREVKIDAGGYPCIDCYIEFYDYDKDIPLAKEGDKVKVILVKGE